MPISHSKYSEFTANPELEKEPTITFRKRLNNRDLRGLYLELSPLVGN